MRIFLTGATGFIGTHLAKLLVNNGHIVTALLRNNNKKNKLPESVKIIHGDLSLFENKNIILPEFDVVIHLAGGGKPKKNKTGYFKDNYYAVKHLVTCIQRQNWKLKRFIFASSMAAAGPSMGNVLNEENEENPIDDYGMAKLAAEIFLNKITDFPTTSFRPAIVIGSGDENTLTLFKIAQKNICISINGMKQNLSFIDIADLNNAILRMALDNSSHNKKYFVSNPNQTSNEIIFKQIGKLIQKRIFIIPLPKPILYFGMLISTMLTKVFGMKNRLDKKQFQQLTNHFMCSSESLALDYNWEPKFDLEASLTKAYDGFIKAGQL